MKTLIQLFEKNIERASKGNPEKIRLFITWIGLISLIIAITSAAILFNHQVKITDADSGKTEIKTIKELLLKEGGE